METELLSFDERRSTNSFDDKEPFLRKLLSELSWWWLENVLKELVRWLVVGSDCLLDIDVWCELFEHGEIQVEAILSKNVSVLSDVNIFSRGFLICHMFFFGDNFLLWSYLFFCEFSEWLSHFSFEDK